MKKRARKQDIGAGLTQRTLSEGAREALEGAIVNNVPGAAARVQQIGVLARRRRRSDGAPLLVWVLAG